MTLTVAIPRLDTENLIIRSPVAHDFDTYCAFAIDPIRSAGFGTEEDRPKAWRWFASNLGHWALRGYGYFIIEDKASGQACGLCGIWEPEGWPEPEIGWVVFEGYEGKGIAHEAALRVREWAYTDLGLTTLTSNIVPGNDRSVALAKRLGAWFEREYVNVQMGVEQLYRHPAPADLGISPDSDGNPEAYA
ncbi:MAG: GNAT family N-acetyltransferase [Roseovarius sp.]